MEEPSLADVMTMMVIMLEVEQRVNGTSSSSVDRATGKSGREDIQEDSCYD